MSALILGFLEWLGGIIASDLITRLKAYIEGKVKEKQDLAQKKAEVQAEIDKLKQAQTKEDFDAASKNILDRL